MLNTTMVYLIAGAKASLLFAVCPICVNNVAWITGSYYSTATFLTLGGFYVLQHSPWWAGVPFAAIAFSAALNATLVTISFPFIAIFATPLAAVYIIPLATFLFGKRFTEGKKIREGHLSSPGVLSDKFTWDRPVFCIKAIAHYLFLACFPYKLCFFHFFGFKFSQSPQYRKVWLSLNGHFWASCALIISFLGFGFVLGKLFWAGWFLVLIAAFSQYKILGQYFAERYMYPAMVGFCAVLSTIPGDFYWVVVGLYIMRTFMFIPVFSSNRELYKNGTVMDPDDSSSFCNLSDWYLVTEPDLSLAGHYAQEALKRDPEDFKPHLNMSSLFIHLKQFPFALKEAEEALRKAEGKCQPWIIDVMTNQAKRIREAMGEKK